MEEKRKKPNLALWLVWLVRWPPSTGFLAVLSVELGLVWWGMATDFYAMDLFIPPWGYFSSSDFISLGSLIIHVPLALLGFVFYMFLRKYPPARNHWLLAVACMSAITGLFLNLFVPNFL